MSNNTNKTSRQALLWIASRYLAFIGLLGRGGLAWLSVVVVVFVFNEAIGNRIVYSTTPSLQESLFVLTDIESAGEPVQRGTIAVVCLTADQLVKLDRNHLPFGENVSAARFGCADGAILKRVYAVPGDVVSAERSGIIRINGAAQAFIPEKAVHSKGVPFYEGTRFDRTITLAANEYFVLGDHTLSFDSRYIGVIERQNIMGRALLAF